MLKDGVNKWSAADSEELYGVPRWGKGYFSIGRNGNLLVHPERDPSRQIDLKQLVDRLIQRGIELPVLVRFNDILKDRLNEIRDAFRIAISEHDYQGTYSCVYPIKVNQQRQVVEKILQHGKSQGIGLEAGSKPELLAVVAMIDDDTPIICNGFKDSEFIHMALVAQKIGRRVIPVVEKIHRTPIDPKRGRRAWRAASDRHASQTRIARRRSLENVRVDIDPSLA